MAIRLIALLASSLFASTTSAETFTWNGGGGDPNWNTSGNWTGGIPASVNTTTIVLTGTTNTTTNNNIPSVPFTLNALTLDTTGTPSLSNSGFTINGGALNFDGSGANITRNYTSSNSASSSTPTGTPSLYINTAINFTAATTIILGANRTGVFSEVVLGGRLTGSGAVGVVNNVSTNDEGTNNLNADISLLGANSNFTGTYTNAATGSTSSVTTSLGAANALGRGATVDLRAAGTSSGLFLGIQAATVTGPGQVATSGAFNQQFGALQGAAGTLITLNAPGSTTLASTALAGFNNAPTTHAGTLAGVTASHFGKVGTGTLTLTGSSSSYAGTFSVRDGSVNLALANGRLSNATTAVVIFAGATLLADNSSNNQQDRLPGTTTASATNIPLALAGGTLQLTGNANTNTSEGIAGFRLLSGQSTILVDGVVTGRAHRINAAGTAVNGNGGLLQSNNSTATVFFRSTNLGQQPSTTGSNVGSVTFAAAPTLVGGNGATTTSLSILPFGLGTGATSASSMTTPESFVTYSTANNSIRSLTDAEYANAFGNTTDNVSLAANTTVATPTTANSLRITGGFTTLDAPLTLTAGALLTTGITAFDGNGPLVFGSTGNATAYITTLFSNTFSTPVQAAHLSKNGPGGANFSNLATITLSATNPVIAVNAGTLQVIPANVSTSAPLSASNVLTYQVSKGAALNLGNPLAIDDFKVLQGSGSVAGGNVTVSGTGVIRPSSLGGSNVSLASPGTLTVTAATFGPGGTYEWFVSSVYGGEYTQSKLTGAGTLEITATAGTPFNIKVTPLQLSNALGGPVYDAETGASYSWVIASYAGGITGNTGTENFHVQYNPADFAGANLTANVINNDLVLVATPIPEPAALLGLAALGLGGVRLLRRRYCRSAVAVR